MSTKAKTISLDACKLPQGALLHLFQQLPMCAVLENLNIHKTHVAIVKSLDLSNLKSLTSLKLPKLSPELCHSILWQIGDLDRLINLDLNGLTVRLFNFLPETHHRLISLKFFSLADNALTKSDLTHVTKLIEQLKIPNLCTLTLRSYNLNRMEDTLAELLEACITHHNTELTVILWDIELSEEFEETWKSRCKGTRIILQFNW